MQGNLLEDPLITVRCRDANERAAAIRRRMTLPGVLAALMRDEVAAFPALAPWQEHPWHALLVQLAALALHRGRRRDPPESEREWAELLRALAAAEGWQGGDEPWCLVVDDWTKPAFLQPPLPAETHAELTTVFMRPDEIDVLVTAKNHDVKAARIARPSPEEWLFALVSGQTAAGYSGRSWYGIARMNGGYSSRAGFGIAPGVLPGAHVRRDVAVLLARRREHWLEAAHAMGARERPWAYRDDGHGLLWLLPWDGRSQLAVSDLDPWFIEICRRYRLVRDGAGALEARGAGSRVARIDAAAFHGNLGDPWLPVSRTSGHAITVGPLGLRYDRLAEYVWDSEYEPPLALRWHSGIDQGSVILVARVLVRGQGGTEGYYERRIPFPAQTGSLLFAPQERDRVGEIVKERLEEVEKMIRQVLRPALIRRLRPGDGATGRPSAGEEAWIRAAQTRLHHAVDGFFFGAHLWEEVDAGADPAKRARARQDWRKLLIDAAREVFMRALEEPPQTSARRYRAVAEAETVFKAGLRRHFPQLAAEGKEVADV